MIRFQKLSKSAVRCLSSSALPIADPYEKLPEKFRDKILFSSYLESKYQKLGYTRNKIAEQKFHKELYRQKMVNTHVKPFPLALRALAGENEVIPPVKNANTAQTEEVFSKNRQVLKETPINWMDDYEYYNPDDDSDSPPSFYGTSDINEPPSRVPCNGCGAHLQCADSGLPGYIPSEIFKYRTNKELQQISCQRCHFLVNYNVALDVNVTPETYIKTISSIKDKTALAILIVDLLDFPCSIWPEIQTILGNKRPVFVVGNKVDLLPKDSKGYLDHIKRSLKEAILRTGLDEMNIKHVGLISAKTGYGIEELITQLHNIWKYKGDVYLVGCTNVGKSSLFNALLRSDYCKVEASDLVKRATSCPWPGTTLQMLKFPILRPSDYRIFQRYKRLTSQRVQHQAEAKLRQDQLRKTGKVEYATLIGHIGQTFAQQDESSDVFAMTKGVQPILSLDEKAKNFAQSKWCYDTPGVVQPEQIHNLLTTEELLLACPNEMIVPRVFLIKPEMTLLLAGLGRLDFISGDFESIRIAVYASAKLPILICQTNSAANVYDHFLGTELLEVPKGNEERLSTWPALKPSDEINLESGRNYGATCDILLSSAGWIAVTIPDGKHGKFQAWTPEGRGIVVRSPPLIPFGDTLRGSKIRGSLAYRIGKPFIKQ